MSRVLLAGESWFSYTVHQKGFDTFTTSEYTEGAGEFLGALRGAGHDVTYVPAHEVHTRLDGEDAFDAFDVIVISDVGGNTFQLAPQTFNRSEPSPDKAELVRRRVEAGAGLLMVGGYLTFTGIDAKARWGSSPLAPALPVRLQPVDDRVELPSGAAPAVVTDHPVVEGLGRTWPQLLGLNEVTVGEGATLLAECAGRPLLVVGEYGAGRSAAFTSDIAPHWAPPPFLGWDGYGRLFDQLVRWLAGTAPQPA
jgi:uncharacterized membrane protein